MILISLPAIICYGSLVFILLSHIAPYTLNKLTSNAFTSQLHWNYGVEAFNFQLVNLVVYHTTMLARVTHATLLLDVLSWAVILSQYGLVVVVGMLTLIVWQTVSFCHAPTVIITVLSWCGVSSLVHFFFFTQLTSIMDPQTMVQYAYLCVCICGMVRVLGHFAEPCPPLILSAEQRMDRQKKIQDGTAEYDMYQWEDKQTDSVTLVVMLLWKRQLNPIKAVVIPVLGVFAEISAGLPGRLFAPLIYVLWNNMLCRCTRLKQDNNNFSHSSGERQQGGKNGKDSREFVSLLHF
jgi:hypothetical protein